MTEEYCRNQYSRLRLVMIDLSSGSPVMKTHDTGVFL